MNKENIRQRALLDREVAARKVSKAPTKLLLLKIVNAFFAFSISKLYQFVQVPVHTESRFITTVVLRSNSCWASLKATNMSRSFVAWVDTKFYFVRVLVLSRAPVSSCVCMVALVCLSSMPQRLLRFKKYFFRVFNFKHLGNTLEIPNINFERILRVA